MYTSMHNIAIMLDSHVDGRQRTGCSILFDDRMTENSSPLAVSAASFSLRQNIPSMVKVFQPFPLAAAVHPSDT